MTNDTLVSINVINEKTNTLLNLSQVPILYYWNGEGDLIKSIINDKSFKDQYIYPIRTYNDYNNRLICFFHFKFNDETGDEEYYDTGVSIKEYFPLSELDKNITLDLLQNKMIDLYKISINQDFVITSQDKEETIKQIYTKLKSLFGERVQQKTLVNYIRSILSKEDLNSENSYYAINILENILDESKM